MCVCMYIYIYIKYAFHLTITYCKDLVVYY